jgi:hypothetical protein
MLKLDCAGDGCWHLFAKDGTQLVMSFVSKGDALDYVRDLNERWHVDVTVDSAAAEEDYPLAAE